MKSLIKNGMTILCLAVIIAVALPAQAGKKDKDKGNNNGAIQALQAEDDNLHRRIDAIEDGGTGPDLSGYGVPFSAEGTLKNVVVLSQDLGNGNTLYKIRSRYANSTEEISINSSPIIKPFIANNVRVETDGSGDIISLDNNIDAPDTANYENYNVESSTYDVGQFLMDPLPDPLMKTVIHDTNREVFTCSGSTVQLCTSYAIDVTTDFFSYIYTWNSIMALGGPYTFNDMTFDDVRMESYTAPSGKSRIRAKGIGMIFEENNNGNDHDGQQIIIYYQANGSSVGKLEGTPFDTGQPLYGLFF